MNVINCIESIGGALAAVLTIIYFFKIVIFPFFAKMQLQLTDDIFFRLTDSGEGFFPRIIIYSPINMQTTSIVFELKRTGDKAQTQYACKAEGFGSVEKNAVGGHVFPSYYFDRKTPIYLFTKDNKEQMLIHCSISESKSTIEDAVRKLSQEYIDVMKGKSDNKTKSESIEALMEECSTEILSNIKIEKGEHKLVCKIKYTYKIWGIITRKKEAQSSVNLSFDAKSLNNYKSKFEIQNFLYDCMQNKQGKNINIRYPELNPKTD